MSYDSYILTFDFTLSKRRAHGYAGKDGGALGDTEGSYFLLRNAGGSYMTLEYAATLYQTKALSYSRSRLTNGK
jgi:hypothetical protein